MAAQSGGNWDNLKVGVNDQFPQLDKAVIRAFQTFEEADAWDREYWRSKTPEERLAALELTRQINYGYDPASARIQRVLEVVELE